MRDTVLATLRYARGDGEKLLTEKPYILTYPTSEGIPWSNFTIDFHPGIKIHSLRSANLDYNRSGLAMGKLESCMPPSDFDDESKIESTYLPAVHRCLQKTLGAKEIYIFDYVCEASASHRKTPSSIRLLTYQTCGTDDQEEKARIPQDISIAGPRSSTSAFCSHW